MAGKEYENKYYAQGFTYIAGTDEAGRGPLAGPVVVGACILPKNYDNPLIDDSKKLTDKKRRELFEIIKDVALAYSIIIIGPEEIDRTNIYECARHGMSEAIRSLGDLVDVILTDAMPLKNFNQPLEAIIKGDANSQTIAAASILAKVTRDDLMIEYDKLYPQYNFAKNKGYGTKDHFDALEKYGPCPIHRKTFEPIRSMIALKLDLHFDD